MSIRSLLAELISDMLIASFIPSHHNQDQPGSVSSVLLDYTILTMLLLGTLLREWMRFSHQVPSTWGDDERASDEWEEPSRFRWGRPGSHGHRHKLGPGLELGLGRQQQQDQRQDQQLPRGGRGQSGDGSEEVDRWAATEDDMRNAALFTASRFARRRSTVTVASTDSSRTLVVPITATTTHMIDHFKPCSPVVMLIKLFE